MLNKILQKCSSVDFDIVHWCAAKAGDDKIIEKIMSNKAIKTAVEIGTHYGVSTLLMSQFAEKVISFDCVDYKEREIIWNNMGIKNVEFVHINNETKKNIINNLDFDFTFIDGDHKEGVFLDAEICKKCNRLLFHDYSDDKDYINIKKCVDSFNKDQVTLYKGNNAVFAYWENT
jgi:hypothetical protein